MQLKDVGPAATVKVLIRVLAEAKKTAAARGMKTLDLIPPMFASGPTDRHYYVSSLEAVTTALNDAKDDYVDDLAIEDFISAPRNRIRLDAVLQVRPADIIIEEQHAMPFVLEAPEVVKDEDEEMPGLPTAEEVEVR